MKTLLVVPNYAARIANVAQTTLGPPLGLAYIAAVMERRGLPVEILDANALNLSDAATVAEIAGRRPEIVGFSAVTPTVDQCGRLAAAVKSSLPSAKIALGGMHPTALPEPTLARYPAVDFAVGGEADSRFPDIVEGLSEGRPLDGFPAVWHRVEGAIVGTGGSYELEDLDLLPFPARHRLPTHRYIGPDGDGFTTVVGSRGCPADCGYCSVNLSFGKRMRLRDPGLVADEMAECVERFGTRVFGFVDDTFTASRKWAEQLCAAVIDRGVHRSARWLCLTRVDRVDRELLRTMKEAGCFKVEFGIESGDQEVLDDIQKGITPRQVIEAFRQAKDVGLHTFAFVMLFAPEETPRSLAVTRAIVRDADPDYLQVSFCTPYPGTTLAADFAKRGIPMDPDWSRYVFLTTPAMHHPLFTEAEMREVQRRFLRSFYLRPRTLVRIVRNVWETGGWRGFFRTASAGVRSLARGPQTA